MEYAESFVFCEELHVLEGTGACDEPGEAVGQLGDKFTMREKNLIIKETRHCDV